MPHRHCFMAGCSHRPGGRPFPDEAIADPFVDGMTPLAILTHRWPRPADLDFSVFRAVCEAEADRAQVSRLSSGIFGNGYRMSSFDRFLRDITSFGTPETETACGAPRSA
jgi:hypothetical protein